MQLNLADVLALGASDDYEIIAALSGNSVALALCVCEWLHDTDNWEGASYILTSGEKDTIDSLIGVLIYELTTAYEGNGGNGEMSAALVVDQKTQGTHGGTFTTGAWRVRDLNNISFDPDDIVDVADDQFTLQAGTYILMGIMPAYRVAGCQGMIYNVTAAQSAGLGQSQYFHNANSVGGVSIVFGHVVLTEETSFELWHKCITSVSTWGYGLAANLTWEIYSMVLIVKVA